MRRGKYFLPPTWPGSHGGGAQIPAHPSSSGVWATIAKARIAAAEARASTERLIEAIRISIEQYAPTKEKADDR